MAIRIITDSAADFTQQQLQQMNVTCVPMQITFGSESYSDGTGISREDFWTRCMGGETAKTSQPAPDAFLNEFRLAAEAGDSVLCILISSALSGTLQSATLATGMVEGVEVHIVDSLTATACQRTLIAHAAMLRDRGDRSVAQIAEEITSVRSRFRLFACLDTLEYLVRGGRLSRSAASIGTLVQLKPIITLNSEGAVAIAGKAIGRHRAIDTLVKLIAQQKLDPAFTPIPIYSYDRANCDAFLKKLSAASIPFDADDVSSIGATIATHIGPNAYGLTFVVAE